MRGLIWGLAVCTAFWLGVGVGSIYPQEAPSSSHSVEMHDDGQVIIHTDQRHLKTKDGALIVLEEK